ncbi:MAG: helix-turn-helix transcriptional regulator [Verrucomicrobiota bacterium]
MNEATQLISVLKRQLKLQGRTYKDVAVALQLSEPSVKRLFASKRLTLERLSRLSAFVGFTLAELTQEAQSSAPKVAMLTVEQEAQLVSDSTLLLVAVCALNHWSLADIVTVYQLSEVDCLRYLLQLDRLKIIELLPGNRIRLAVTRDFDWLPDGPIRRYFSEQCQSDFINSSFRDSTEHLSFVHGMLSVSAMSELHQELRRLRKRFSELHQESVALPVGMKFGTGLLLAAREWEPRVFSQMRRELAH